MTHIKQTLFSARLERSRIVTWLRRRSESAECRAIADEIEAEVDVEETQDLRDSSGYPTDKDAAFAIGGWAAYQGLTDEERETLKRVASRLSGGASDAPLVDAVQSAVDRYADERGLPRPRVSFSREPEGPASRVYILKGGTLLVARDSGRHAHVSFEIPQGETAERVAATLREAAAQVEYAGERDTVAIAPQAR